MRRLSFICGLSIALYAALFCLLLDRPLSLGQVRTEMDAKLGAAAAIDGPKLVVLAGSNGTFSHRCETIAPIVGRPCVNGGAAVGIGVDYLFARWKAVLRPDDIVYLPLEEAHFRTSAQAARLGPDAAIMARHDWTTLGALMPDRWIAALFAFDLRAAAMSAFEMAIHARSTHDPRANTLNAWGDRIGHTPDHPAASRHIATLPASPHATPAQIANSAAGEHLAEFLDWADRHGIRAVGGLPTGFDDSPVPDDTVAALRSLFATHNAAFVVLPNRSRYPRDRFFDSADHLNEPAQIAHSGAVAVALRSDLIVAAK